MALLELLLAAAVAAEVPRRVHEVDRVGRLGQRLLHLEDRSAKGWTRRRLLPSCCCCLLLLCNSSRSALPLYIMHASTGVHGHSHAEKIKQTAQRKIQQIREKKYGVWVLAGFDTTTMRQHHAEVHRCKELPGCMLGSNKVCWWYRRCVGGSTHGEQVVFSGRFVFRRHMDDLCMRGAISSCI